MFLVTGAGLVVHLLVGLPLWLTVAGGLMLATAGLLYAGRGGAAARLLPAVRAGLASGAVATVAYDASRWLFAAITGSSVGRSSFGSISAMMSRRVARCSTCESTALIA